MNKTICVDASFIISLLLPEELSYIAIRLWKAWLEQETEFIAPTLLGYEVASALYQKALRGQITRGDSLEALEQFLGLDINLLYLPETHLAATELANTYNRANTYDCHYLALAIHSDCLLWTADERFYNALKGQEPLVHWLGEEV